ncbi:MAG: porin family protein [Alphaproteobacteria bacterium]|nr:porin family protein [Alphaproteobacteria bacterium]
MKKFLLLASALCFAAASASAFEFNPYISAKAKYSLARHELKVTGTFQDKAKLKDEIFGGSLAVGNIYNVMNGDFRIELEYTKNADAKKHQAKAKTQAALFNVYYDLNLNTSVPVKPYVGAGLGWGQTKVSGNGQSIKDDTVAVQIGCGINYYINQNFVVDLGYRYINYGDFDKEYRIPGLLYEKYEYKPFAHEFLLGLRYEF